jgi:hypothetical protein
MGQEGNITNLILLVEIDRSGKAYKRFEEEKNEVPPPPRGNKNPR